MLFSVAEKAVQEEDDVCVCIGSGAPLALLGRRRRRAACALWPRTLDEDEEVLAVRA